MCNNAIVNDQGMQLVYGLCGVPYFNYEKPSLSVLVALQAVMEFL